MQAETIKPMEDGTMQNKLKIITVALAISLLSPTLTLTAGEAQDGTVIAVEETTVKFKGADGKMYEMTEDDVMGEDLKTGDIVEYELVEGKPVKERKKK
jgi:hypothetical protein